MQVLDNHMSHARLAELVRHQSPTLRTIVLERTNTTQEYASLCVD